MQQKKWYQSKTMWGAIVAMLAMALKQFGFADIAAADQQELTNMIMTGVGLFGGGLAMYGRATASATIGKPKPKKRPGVARIK